MYPPKPKIPSQKTDKQKIDNKAYQSDERDGTKLCRRVTEQGRHGWGFVVYACVPPGIPGAEGEAGAGAGAATEGKTKTASASGSDTEATSGNETKTLSGTTSGDDTKTGSGSGNKTASTASGTASSTTGRDPSSNSPRTPSPVAIASNIAGYLQRWVEYSIETSESAPIARQLKNSMDWDLVYLPQADCIEVQAHFNQHTVLMSLYDEHERYERLPLMIDAGCVENLMELRAPPDGARGDFAQIIRVMNPAFVPDGWDRTRDMYLENISERDPHPFWACEGIHCRPEDLWCLYHMVMLRMTGVTRLEPLEFGPMSPNMSFADLEGLETLEGLENLEGLEKLLKEEEDGGLRGSV